MNKKIIYLKILRCRIADFCVQTEKQFRINPSNQLIIQSNCIDGCENSKSISYTYNLYFSTTTSNWQSLNSTIAEQYLTGLSTKELTISNKLFDLFSNYFYWKIEFQIQTLALSNLILNGSTRMILKLNQKPLNGSCKSNSTQGFALVDNFLIECTDWTDPDGLIVRYEYFIKNSNQSNSFLIGFNSNGILLTKLPLGENILVYIQIYDDSDGFTEYDLPVEFRVTQKPGYFESISSDLVQISDLIAFGSILNSNQSDNSKILRDIMINVTSSLVITDISSVKLISSVLSVFSDDYNQLSLYSAEKSITKSIELSEALLNQSNSTGLFKFFKFSLKIIKHFFNSLQLDWA